MVSRDLIQHLTKEIELATELQIQQRTKNNLSVAFGPYIVLGGYLFATKTPPDFAHAPRWALGLAFIVFLVLYAFLGYMAATVEGRLWDQCNQWRKIIAQITGSPPAGILFEKRGLLASYISVYLTLAILFVVVVFLLANL
jgi:hypothetical protein